MSIFDSIKTAIFGARPLAEKMAREQAEAQAAQQQQAAAPAAGAPAMPQVAQPQPQAAAPTATAPIDVEAMLTQKRMPRAIRTSTGGRRSST